MIVLYAEYLTMFGCTFEAPKQTTARRRYAEKAHENENDSGKRALRRRKLPAALERHRQRHRKRHRKRHRQRQQRIPMLFRIVQTTSTLAQPESP